MESKPPPYLSIVIAARNDNYGGDFTARLQNAIDWNTRLLEHYSIPTEVIIVNWNPLVNVASLRDTIRWSANRKSVYYRIVTVPEVIHQTFDDSHRKRVPLYEFIAKNAGIARSSGQYILCTNADVWIHPRIMQYIAERRLDPKHFYRADRLDFDGLNAEASVANVWKHARVVSLKGYKYRFHNPATAVFHYRMIKAYNPLRVRWQLFKAKYQHFFSLLGVEVITHNAAFYAHCNNCGDFMLMHHSLWQTIKGYPEHTTVATHTDALCTMMALQVATEKVFAYPVFHLEHVRRYTWDDIEKKPELRSAFLYFEQEAQKMIQSGEVPSYNTDWGLVNYQLPQDEF